MTRRKRVVGSIPIRLRRAMQPFGPRICQVEFRAGFQIPALWEFWMPQHPELDRSGPAKTSDPHRGYPQDSKTRCTVTFHVPRAFVDEIGCVLIRWPSGRGRLVADVSWTAAGTAGGHARFMSGVAALSGKLCWSWRAARVR